MTEGYLESTKVDKKETSEENHIRVLLVDDETGFLNVSKKILEMKEPLQVDTASSVKEAYVKLNEKKFDVIVSDYQMPIKDGLQFLEELKEKGANIPFILFTGKGREEVTIRVLNLGANRYINKNGKPETVYGELTHAIVQAAEKQRSEQMLIENEEKYRVLVERAADGVAIIQGKVVKFVNERLAKMIGYKPEELIDSEFAKAIPPENREWLMDRYKKRQAGEDVPSIYEIPVLKKNGEKIQVELNTAIIQYEEKPATMAVIRDITERKKTEDNLRVQKDFIDGVINAMDDTFFIFEPETGKTIAWNTAFKKISGYSNEEIRSLKAPVSYFNEEDLKISANAIQKINKNGRAKLEMSLITKDGKHVPFEYVGVRVKSPEGKPWICAIGRNLTERKKAEDELSKELTLMETLLGHHPDFIYFKDNKARFQRVSNRFCEFFMLDKEEIIGKTDLELFPKEIAKQTYNEDLQIIKTGKPIINKEENAKGSWVLTTKMPWFNKNGKIVGLFGISRDITERKKAEEEIKDLAKFPSENPNPVLRIAKDGTILFSNKAAQILINEGKLDEKQHIVELIQQSVLDCLGSGLLEEVEVKVEDKIFSLVFAPVVESGYINIYGLDITDRKKAEKSLNVAFDELALVNEKLGVVGRLTRHDARNKLTALMVNIYLAKQVLPPDSESLKYLTETESATEQIEKIFDFAQIYEQLGVEELWSIDVGESFERATSLLPDSPRIELVNDCSGVEVLADSLLDTLFYNLIDNSIKHGYKVSRIRIYCKTGKNKLKIVYEDDGVGIPKAEKKKIFIEGYGKGTGLGLHLIKIMCTIYGWTIKETGKHGKGSQFTITIPKTNKNGQIGYRIH